MISQEVRDRLIKLYGTDKPGDCAHCNQVSAGTSYKPGIKCGKSQCLLLTQSKLIQTKLDAKKNSGDTSKAKVINKLNKLNMLGYTEISDPPWIILKSENDMMWVNPRLGVSSQKQYKDYKVIKNMIVCLTSLKPRYCEVYSIYSGLNNLVQDIPEITYSTYNNPMYSLATMLQQNKIGLVYCKAKDPASGANLGVLINELGDKLVFPFSDKLSIEDSIQTDGYMIALNKQRAIRTDRRFNIQRAPSDIPVFKM